MNIRKLKPKQMNKKANIMLIIIFFIALFAILFIGFIMVVGSSVLNFVFDETIPELTNLGEIGAVNLTESGTLMLNPVNSIIQNLTWMTGLFFMLMLIGSFGIIFIARTSANKWLIGLYFMLAIVLVMGSIFISNMYEEFYEGTDDLATRLQEHTLLSWMILYSPTIFTVIVFLTGIILFSGLQTEEFI